VTNKYLYNIQIGKLDTLSKKIFEEFVFNAAELEMVSAGSLYIFVKRQVSK